MSLRCLILNSAGQTVLRTIALVYEVEMPFPPPAIMLKTDRSAVVLAFKTASAVPRRGRTGSLGRAKTEAVDLQRWREEAFVSTFAQELRQPLLVLSAAVEVIRLAPGSEVAARATNAIERQIGQINRIAKDLTDAMRRVPQGALRNVASDDPRPIGPRSIVASHAPEIVHVRSTMVNMT